MLLAMANRPIDNNTTFTTGGDVSRFQRRTVPARPADKAEAVAKGASSLGKGLGQAMDTGPVVRIARGNNVTVVPVGAR
jgi:pilus assembly protein CpaB